jgi:hypothetical protein
MTTSSSMYFYDVFNRLKVNSLGLLGWGRVGVATGVATGGGGGGGQRSDRWRHKKGTESIVG